MIDACIKKDSFANESKFDLTSIAGIAFALKMENFATKRYFDRYKDIYISKFIGS